MTNSSFICHYWHYKEINIFSSVAVLYGLFFILGGFFMYDLICSYLNSLVPLLPFLIALRLIFDLLRNLVFDTKRSV